MGWVNNSGWVKEKPRFEPPRYRGCLVGRLAYELGRWRPTWALATARGHSYFGHFGRQHPPLPHRGDPLAAAPRPRARRLVRSQGAIATIECSRHDNHYPHLLLIHVHLLSILLRSSTLLPFLVVFFLIFVFSTLLACVIAIELPTARFLGDRQLQVHETCCLHPAPSPCLELDFRAPRERAGRRGTGEGAGGAGGGRVVPFDLLIYPSPKLNNGLKSDRETYHQHTINTAQPYLCYQRGYLISAPRAIE